MNAASDSPDDREPKSTEASANPIANRAWVRAAMILALSISLFTLFCATPSRLFAS